MTSQAPLLSTGQNVKYHLNLTHPFLVANTVNPRLFVRNSYPTGSLLNNARLYKKEETDDIKDVSAQNVVLFGLQSDSIIMY